MSLCIDMKKVYENKDEPQTFYVKVEHIPSTERVESDVSRVSF